MAPPHGGSDHASFLNYVGIPSAYSQYIRNGYSSYDLYHTQYETFWTIENLVDLDKLVVHRAMLQFWLNSLVLIADELVIPFNTTDYGTMVVVWIDALLDSINADANFIKAIDNYAQIESGLRDGARRFHEQCEKTQSLIDHANSGVESVTLAEVNALNHRVLGLERCFISPRNASLPDHPQRRHVIFAPSTTNLYAGTLFSTVPDSYARMQEAKSEAEALFWRKNLNEELTAIRYAIETAIDWLHMDLL